MKRISMKNVKLDAKVATDSGVSSLLVNVGPGLLNKFVFSSSPLTGMALNVAGVGLCYLAGAGFKRPNIFSSGVGIAVSNLLGEQLPSLIGLTGISDYQMIPSNVIGDYTNNADVVDYNRYNEIYKN